ncbi:Hypothetical predicted protein [Paramuricea clavata]|uniref:Uncharacterized protein n=1 Tax=Paramuricea clavata TaxID=317549 RepID=A0A6S7GUN7_PARCT|nr:Hypothetical predicted protein [Paramuricea clavata]
MFLKAGNTISLLLFEDKLKQLYHIYTSQVAGGSTESFESLDDDSIIEFLLTVEATVCHNTKKNVVSVDKKKLTNKKIVKCLDNLVLTYNCAWTHYFLFCFKLC